MTNEAVRVRSAEPEDMSACFTVRRAVFVEEQKVPPDLEMDGLDGSALHVLAERAERVIGTGRLRVTQDGLAKLERICVVKPARGHGVGVLLVRALENAAANQGCAKVVLSSQLAVVHFYERLGFQGEGDVFMEAGIAHRRMSKPLRGSSPPTDGDPAS